MLGRERPDTATDAANDLSSKEKVAILRNRGRRLALSLSLSALWDTQPKCIEIGSTVLGKSGVRIHVVHYVDSHNVSRIEQCYATHQMQRRVARLLTTHFGLGKQFEVEFLKIESGVPLIAPSSPLSIGSNSRRLSSPSGFFKTSSPNDRIQNLIDEFFGEEYNRFDS